MRFTDKIAIVTGAGSGIGEALAHKLAHEGASVLVADLADSAVADVCDTIMSRSGKAAFYHGDLSDETNARSCVQTAIDAFGSLDILMSNAGVFPHLGDIDTWDAETYDYLVRMNTRPGFLMTKFALPHLKERRGNIVYTGSISGISGSAQLAPYGASKAFVIALMKGVAQEQARYGVRANAIAPGAVATAWTTAGAGGPVTKEVEKLVSGAAPMGRRGTPEEMANVAVFLASEEASYVTGAVFVADGGTLPAQGLPGEQVPAELAHEPASTLLLQHTMDGFRGKPDLA